MLHLIQSQTKQKNERIGIADVFDIKIVLFYHQLKNRIGFMI